MYIEKGGLSGRHAEIKFADKKYYLRDIASTTGTWIQLRPDNPIPIYENLEIKVENEILSFGFGRNEMNMRKHVDFE